MNCFSNAHNLSYTCHNFKTCYFFSFVFLELKWVLWVYPNCDCAFFLNGEIDAPLSSLLDPKRVQLC
jgi:hypothetical protein